MSMQIGARWGHMQCVDIFKQEFEKDYGDGITETWKREVYKLHCECGNEIEVFANEFVGKRKYKDCGCGRASRDGVIVTVNATIPLGARDQLEQIARDETNGNLSAAIALVIRRFVESKEIEVSNAKR